MFQRIKPYLGVFLVLVGVGLIGFRGQLWASDEQLMFFTTAAIAERGSLTFEQDIYGQRFTGYGIGTPLAGLPTYFVEKWLRLGGILENREFSLAPLTNLVLFGLLGVLAAMLAGPGVKRWPVIIAMVASPLLSASNTFYSEVLAAVGLVAVAVAYIQAQDGKKWGSLVALAFAGALISVLARMAQAPLVGFAVIWGWLLLQGKARHAISLGAIGGTALGVLITGIQNWSLRGSLFASGYAGQDFTTPVATGLFGLLFSPERGIIIFWPLVILPLFFWERLDERNRRVAVLGYAVLLFSLVFFARFWTWHGGWTKGPRFLLPAVALLIAPVAAQLGRLGNRTWSEYKNPSYLMTELLLIWSLFIAVIYFIFHPMPVWRELWGLHQQENEWLFMPQLSLWGRVLSGVGPVPAEFPSFFSPWGFIAIVILTICGVAFLWREVKDEQRSRFGFTEFVAIWLFSFVVITIGRVNYPGYWNTQSGEHVEAIPENAEGTFTTYFDDPLNSPVKFTIKTDRPFSISYDTTLVAADTERRPMHFQEFTVDSSVGLHILEVNLPPVDPPGTFKMYWSWGGEGLYLEPVGGPYLYAGTPSILTTAPAWFSRNRVILLAGVLALVLLFFGAKRREP